MPFTNATHRGAIPLRQPGMAGKKLETTPLREPHPRQTAVFSAVSESPGEKTA